MNCKQIVRIICYFISGRGQQIPVKFLRDIMAELFPFETAKLLTLKHWISCLEHVNIHMWDKMEMTIAKWSMYQYKRDYNICTLINGL